MARTTKEWMHELNNEAEEYANFENWRPLEPFKARAHFARSLSLWGQGKDVEALDSLDKAIKAEG